MAPTAAILVLMGEEKMVLADGSPRRGSLDALL